MRVYYEGWFDPPPHPHTHAISVVSGRGASWLILALILFQGFMLSVFMLKKDNKSLQLLFYFKDIRE